MKNLLFGSLCTLLLLLPAVVFGLTAQTGDDITIAKNSDTVGNIYVAAGNATINKYVSGDLYVAGGNLLITEVVEKDLVVAGGSVTVLGDTGDDLRVAGGNVLVAGNVGGELIAAGGSITTAPDVFVEGDALIAGGVMSLAGTVLGDVELYGGMATLGGTINGNVRATVEQLVISEGSVIEGILVYRAASADALKLSDQAIVTGEIVFEEIPFSMEGKVEDTTFGFLGIVTLTNLAIVLFTTLLVTWLFKSFSTSVVTRTIQSPLRMLGYGFVALIVTPIAVLLMFISVLGIPFAVLILLSYVFLLVLASMYAPIVVGVWLIKIIFASAIPLITWKNVIGGVLVLTFISLIPVIGWVFGLAVYLVALGSLVNVVYTKVWSER